LWVVVRVRRGRIPRATRGLGRRKRTPQARREDDQRWVQNPLFWGNRFFTAHNATAKGAAVGVNVRLARGGGGGNRLLNGSWGVLRRLGVHRVCAAAHGRRTPRVEAAVTRT
jgi:hypothetical protein